MGKSVSFQIMNKSCLVEQTKEKGRFKLTIATENNYLSRTFYAMGIASALYHAELTALGVR